jgi:hypothetical protein
LKVKVSEEEAEQISKEEVSDDASTQESDGSDEW